MDGHRPVIGCASRKPVSSRWSSTRQRFSGELRGARPTAIPTPDVRFSSPELVVERFIQAMNSWELAAWELSRAARGSEDPASYRTTVLSMQNDLFAKYCTPRQRPHGRLGSFQRPPEYDPERETSLASKYRETERTSTR